MQSLDLVYSLSTFGKTTLLASAVWYIWQTEQKKALLYTADNIRSPRMRLMRDLGLVEVWYMKDKTTWPKDAKGASMEWTLQLVRNAANGLWPKDGKFIERRDVGLYLFEGLTPFAEWLLSHLSDERAVGGVNYGGLDPSVKAFEIDKSGIRLAGNTWNDYGIVQDEIIDCAEATRNLPGLKIWTALEARGKDDARNRVDVYGPELVGKAKTASLTAKFDNTFNLQVRKEVDKDGVHIRRLHTSAWVGPDSIEHLAAIGAINGVEVKVPSYFDGTGEKPALGEVYALIERSYKVELEKVRAKMVVGTKV